MVTGRIYLRLQLSLNFHSSFPISVTSPSSAMRFTDLRNSLFRSRKLEMLDSGMAGSLAGRGRSGICCRATASVMLLTLTPHSSPHTQCSCCVCLASLFCRLFMSPPKPQSGISFTEVPDVAPPPPPIRNMRCSESCTCWNKCVSFGLKRQT